MKPPTNLNPLEIVDRSEDLTSGFLLWSSARDLSPFDPKAAEEYLLWRVLFADKMGYPTTIDDAIFRVIAEPKESYLSALERYVSTLSKKKAEASVPRSFHKLHKWYYTEAMTSYNLWALLTRREIFSLAQLPSDDIHTGATLSLLDEVVYENSNWAKRAFSLRDSAGRDAYVRWRRSQSFIHCAPWSPVEGADLDELVGLRTATVTPLDVDSQSMMGVNLIGYANTILGLGEDLLSLSQAGRRAGVRTRIVNVQIDPKIGSANPNSAAAAVAGPPLFPVNIYCMPLYETERYRLRQPQHFLRANYNIGHWPWELSSLPPFWRHAFKHVDEIWAISPFVQGVYQRLTEKPVYYMPPLVEIHEAEPFDLTEIGLESGMFVFLTICDLNSGFKRKNSIGTIEAFKRAFPSTNSRERLIIKTLNGHANTEELDHILRVAGSDPRIMVVDGAYARPRLLGMIRAAHCLVSLHRAEGFGRVLAEALLLNTPVIATGYSGSGVFLDESTGFPVKYDILPVPLDDYRYAEGSVWAEPDIAHAAEQMLIVTKNKLERETRTRLGRSRVLANHGLTAVSQRLRERLQEIFSQCGANVTSVQSKGDG